MENGLKVINKGDIKMKEEVKRNYWFMGLSEWFRNRFINITEQVRARNSKGHFVKDDPVTPVNEAYKTVPVRKKRAKKSKTK